MVVWMHQDPMRSGKSYLIKQTTNVAPGEVAEVAYRIDVNTLHPAAVRGRAGAQRDRARRVSPDAADVLRSVQEQPRDPAALSSSTA